MNSTELLNIVEPDTEQTEELANTANTNVELSEEQLDGINGGGDLGVCLVRTLMVAAPVIVFPALIFSKTAQGIYRDMREL
jgi:hypothetical protein